MTQLLKKIQSTSPQKVVFTDLFDTLIHRTVHPNYVLKLWGKFLVRELGLSLSVDELFAIRAEALSYLCKENSVPSVELPYNLLITEVYHRLVNTDLIFGVALQRFEKVFQRADYVAETSVQFKNDTLITDLRQLKEQGAKIYLITDFILPKQTIAQILEHHAITDLFDETFVSCTLQKSKEKGSLYPYVLKQTALDPETVVMMGDNKHSDVDNAKKFGIKGIHLKHLSHKLRNRKNLFGTDNRKFLKACKLTERECQNSEYPYSEYVLHFYFFIERLYIQAQKEGLKNLFFLAREGYFLKQLFDTYQKMNRFTTQATINTHYLKMSRHSALQIALRPLIEENFDGFKGALGRMSAADFLEKFQFSQSFIGRILGELTDPSKNEVQSNFFNTSTFAELRENRTFADRYEAYRVKQRAAFDQYLHSFEVDFKREGIYLVDVGWGGTMQQNLYRYLNEKVPVTGYYVGLKEVYNIQPDTKRYGLNFSIYPSRSYSDNVLMANGQLYEQLLGAPHGSTLGYTSDSDTASALTFHEKNEKAVYENLVQPVQAYMFEQFKILFTRLRSIDYNQEISQQYMTDMALRTGILGKKKNIEFVDGLSRGFYSNVGENKVGVAYSPSQIKGSKLALCSGFLKSPEKLFRYLVKVKPFMYAKGLYWLSPTVNLTYYYIKFNFWFKKRWLGKGLIS